VRTLALQDVSRVRPADIRPANAVNGKDNAVALTQAVRVVFLEKPVESGAMTPLQIVGGIASVLAPGRSKSGGGHQAEKEVQGTLVWSESEYRRLQRGRNDERIAPPGVRNCQRPGWQLNGGIGTYCRGHPPWFHSMSDTDDVPIS
jgi:hypothetical protein